MSMRFVVLIALVFGACLGAFFYEKSPVTVSAQHYATTVAAASGGTYVLLRSLNAFLSTAQEVEVGGSLVVSGTAQPFKVLEPIDDTIERMAELVFFLMVASGVISVALGPASAMGFAMLGLAAAILLVQRFLGSGQTARALSRRMMWYGGFLALAAPLAFVLSAVFADRMTDAVWSKHSAIVADITQQVTPVTEVSEGEGGWFQGAQSVWDRVDRYAEVAANITARADELIASLIAILAVYVFKMLVLPGLVLGAFFVIARFFARRDGA